MRVSKLIAMLPLNINKVIQYKINGGNMKKPLRKTIFIISIILFFNISYAKLNKASSKIPDWISNKPIGKNFDYYTSIVSSSKVLETAQKGAIANALLEIIQEKGAIIVDAKAGDCRKINFTK